MFESESRADFNCCSACSLPIREKHLLALSSINARANKRDLYHESCCSCSKCGLNLTLVGSRCFARANRLLCSNCYARELSCRACHAQISREELVIK